MPTQEHLDIPRRRPLAGIVATVAAALLILVALTAGAAFLLRGEPAEAPDLAGLTLEEAAGVVEAAGLGLLARGDASAATPTALVVAQEPAAGTRMRAGEVVRVDLAEPPALVSVPNALGMTSLEARALLEASGLRLGALRQDLDSTAPPGTVIRQEPGAGSESPAGASVSLWVAGAPTVTLPDLSGLTRPEAETVAAATGLSIRFLAEVTDEVLSGLVFRQSPRAGARVAPGSEIVAVINGGSSDATPGTSNEPVGGGPVGPPPAVFSTLAGTYPFPVLYPASTPPDLVLRTGPDNPGHRTGPTGAQGFEIVYTGSDDPGRSLSLLQGDWFDPGLEGATMIDVRGLTATLVVEGDLIILAWNEDGARYGLTSTGLSQVEVLEIAAGLRPVPSP